MKPRIPQIFQSPVFWLLLGVFALEFFLFDHFGARRHTSIYPRWNDQIQYLTESYTGYEYARSRGFVAGLLNALTNPSAQGTLHDFFAIIAFTIAGPSRSAALSLNMLALIGWQAVLFFAVARTSGSRPLAFAAALLPLALSGPWQNIPGSAYDFRLDHFAMCALGISAATAVLADGFHSRSGSTWFGVAVGLTLLTRFLTGTYFVLIFAGLAAWILLGPPERKPRCLNLLRAGLIAGAMAGPILWMNYDSVRDYYWIGHYIGPESAIRNPNMGLGRSLRFVFAQLAQRHLGIFFGALVAGGTVALAITRSKVRQPANKDAWVVGAVFLLSPALVLTLHPQKSEVVVSALAPGVILLAIAAWATAAQKASNSARSVFATVVTVVTLLFFVRTQVPPAFTPAALAEIRQVNTIADRVFARARAAGLREPKVAVDYITDSLDGQVLRVITYERKRVWLLFDMTLPTGIGEPTEAVVMERLARSDFVFLTEAAPVGPYPFDRKLAELNPQLRAWCESHLQAAERFTLYGRRMVLYQRRNLPLP